MAQAPLAESERRDFWEICEERYQRRSTVLTSQLPISRWHEQIGDPTLADGILDRLVHNAHRIEIEGRFDEKETTVAQKTRSGASPCCWRGKSLCGPFPTPLFSQRHSAYASLRKARQQYKILDEAEHFPHNQKASVASLRLAFDIIPECRSPSLRNGVHLHRNTQTPFTRQPLRCA